MTVDFLLLFVVVVGCFMILLANISHHYSVFGRFDKQEGRMVKRLNPLRSSIVYRFVKFVDPTESNAAKRKI